MKNDEIFNFKFFITFDDLQRRPSIDTIRLNDNIICSNDNESLVKTLDASKKDSVTKKTTSEK